jgi:Tfp pilus assembly protein PilE
MIKRLNETGVTIVELMIAIGIASALASVLVAVSLTFFGDTIRSQVTADMAVESHFMLRTVTEDLRLANSIAVSNDLTDANAPSGGWNTSDADNVLIINSPATTSANDLIYNEGTGDPYNNQLVYFVSEGTLYKRQLKNTLAAGNDLTTTCPTASSSSSCPSDRKYSIYISDLSFTFYDEVNTVTSDPSLARLARINVTMSRRVFGKTLTISNSILTKLRN